MYSLYMWHCNEYFMMVHHCKQRNTVQRLGHVSLALRLVIPGRLATEDCIATCNGFKMLYLKFQEFHFPLSLVVCHLVLKFVIASMCRTVWECYTSKQRVILKWGSFVKKVAPTGIASGFDIGFSQWGLQLITVSLWVYLFFVYDSGIEYFSNRKMNCGSHTVSILQLFL
jgi:hypothetical protein